MPLISLTCCVAFIFKLKLNKSGFKLRLGFMRRGTDNPLTYRFHFLKMREILQLFLQPESKRSSSTKTGKTARAGNI